MIDRSQLIAIIILAVSLAFALGAFFGIAIVLLDRL